MRDYCLKEYRHFVAGLITLFDEKENRYISRFLNGSSFDKARKNTVQVLFPILVPDIPQAHKDGIISMLQSVSQQIFRKDTISQNTQFLLFLDQIQLITLSLLLT